MFYFNSTMASGMAASIRGATESEVFDLAGHGQDNITLTITDAFSEPLPLSEMIRITFITGAGKLGRQKYGENAAKTLTSALRALGYEEDRAASCVVECGGTFKSQHDTGKNLKTIVVFPKIIGIVDAGGAHEGIENMNIAGGESLLEEGSPEHMIALSSQAVFVRMLQSKCQSWAQKKGCLKSLEHIKVIVGNLDSKLMSGTPLSEPEQELYDSVSMDLLIEKESCTRKEMHTHVETGRITYAERDTLRSQVEERLKTIDDELDAASGKPKKTEKLKLTKEKAIARQKMLQDIQPKAPHRLKNEPQIAKLRAEMRPLQKLEEYAKGRLLSVKETTALARKEEILEEIANLEDASREWFEEDSAFEARLNASRAAAKAKEKKKKAPVASSAGSGYKAKPVSSWVTPGATKKKLPAKPTAKSRSNAGGSVFSAMMMDSDSDSD